MYGGRIHEDKTLDKVAGTTYYCVYIEHYWNVRLHNACYGMNCILQL